MLERGTLRTEMEGPGITLTPGFGIVRRTIPDNGIRVAEFLPEILAYHQDRGTQTLDLTYSHPIGRPEDVVFPSPDQEEDPTHVPFQVRTRSEGTVSTQTTVIEGTGVHGVVPLTQVSTLTAPEDGHVFMEVHPRTPPPSPSLSPLLLAGEDRNCPGEQSLRRRADIRSRRQHVGHYLGECYLTLPADLYQCQEA
jgi:hypothetical protein